MIVIRFTDTQMERRGLGYLAGRFPFKSWAGGDTLVPEAALASLAVAGITFTVVGPPTYEQNVPTVRTPPAAAVQ
jgi:7-keto-8-aminopelargonate synthetase-like enzyme